MKLAFISDIHANLPALQAVLKDIQKHQPDDIYCLGDLVNFAGWDNEVIDLIRQNKITTISGNHDEGIGQEKHNFSFSFSNEEQRKFGLKSIAKVNKLITPANRQYLCDLPFMIQLEFRLPLHHVRLAMVHGSTSSNEEYVNQDADEAYILEMMDSINADILLMGHTHQPYHRSIYCAEENKKIYRHAINVGSVGKPKHGNSLSCYAIVNINKLVDLNDPYSVSAQFCYVPYDTESVIKKIKENDLPDAYDDFIRKGSKQ